MSLCLSEGVDIGSWNFDFGDDLWPRLRFGCPPLRSSLNNCLFVHDYVEVRSIVLCQRQNSTNSMEYQSELLKCTNK